MIWLQLAWRELSNNRKFAAFFIASLSVGLIGYIVINSFKILALEYLEKDLKKILTADVSVFSRVPFTNEQIQLVDSHLQYSEKTQRISFFSMLNGNDVSRLVRVEAIQDNFPLYGSLKLESEVATQEDISLLEKQNQIFMSRETRLSLGLKKFNTVKLGEYEFIVGKDVSKNPLNVFSNAAIAPIIYVSLEKIADTKLIQRGSRITYLNLYKTHVTEKNIKQLTANIKKSLDSKFGVKHNIRVRSYLNANDRVSQIIEYATGYLGLIASAALFIISIGISYMLKNYIGQRIQEIAILLSMGVARRNVYKMFFYQLFFLGIAASILSLIFVAIILYCTSLFFSSYIPDAFHVRLPLESIFLSIILGVCTNVVFSIPILISLKYLKPVSLFRESKRTTLQIPNKFLQYLSYVPALVFFWILAMWQTDFFQGSLFLIIFTVCIIFFIIIGLLFLFFLDKSSFMFPLFLRLAVRNLTRKKLSSLILFVALASNTMIFNTIPQIQSNLKEEMQTPKNIIVPDFFLFDIQPEQIASLKTLLKEQGYKLDSISPLIRARLQEINEKSIVKNDNSIEEQGFSRRQGFNISYREKLSPSESIVEGRPFSSQNSDNIVEISVERDFAQRRNFKIGDILTFNIQGIELNGKIVNFRRVRWNSFQPNFYVLFQTGVLEDAPQTFLASIAQVSSKEKVTLQTKISQSFPNISIINVTEIIKSLVSISDKVVWIIFSLTFLSLLAVIFLIFLVIRTEAAERSWEISLLKSFGLSTHNVAALSFLEIILLGTTASLTGILISYFFFNFVMHYLFGGFGYFHLDILAIVLFSALFVLLIVSFFAIKKIIKEKPLQLIRG